MMIGQRTGREDASRWRRMLALALTLILVLPAAAQAATVTNTNDSGPGSLRGAIAGSASGDTINFSTFLNGQTITLTSGEILISHALTISGPGATNLTINSNHNGRAFNLDGPSANPVTISGLTFTGGAVSGTGDAGGGAILDQTPSAVTLSGLTITGNQVTASNAGAAGGGGVYADGGPITITGSTITNNQVTVTGADASVNGGGGVYSNGGTLTINGSVVSANSAVQTASAGSSSDGGGGIYSDGGDVGVTNTTISGNSSSIDSTNFGSDGGGGIYSDGGNVTLSGATVNANTFTLSNSAGGNNGGGGVYSNGGDVTTTATSLDGNTASIRNDTSTQGENGGGGVFSQGGTVAVDSSSISDNTTPITAAAGGNGGGAVLDEGDTARYVNSTLSNNSTTINGGGAQDGGGAINVLDGGSATDVTIAGNTSNRAGGGVLNQGGAFDLRNTILSGNGASPAGNCAGTFASAGFNLDSGDTCGLNVPGDLVNTDPQLGPLQDNGGPTLTQGLAASSPAVDAGSCTDDAGAPVPFDQRGVARPQPPGGKCDIGALELAPAPVVSSVSPNSGQAIGGITVTITGSHFNGTSAVHFGAAVSPSFTVVSDTQIRAVAPPGTGTVDVIVTSLGRPSTTSPADRFTYVSHPAVNTSTAAPKVSAATLTGNVNPEGEPTTVFFQYGLNLSLRPPNASKALYDQSTPPQSLPGDGVIHVVSAAVGNLVPNALYHVRLVAVNSSGSTFGADQTFKTLTGPPPPPPVLGKSQNVDPVSGHVFVLVHGKLVPLTLERNVPSGTTVDARRGSVELSAAATKTRKHQTGVFSGAIFALTQARSGLTTLSLSEGAFKGAPSYASCRAHKTADGHTAVSSRVLQTLRSRATGRFRTRGRYAAGTVRGTGWTTADRCDGTLIAVQLHSVLVTDLVKHITVLVKAGHRYLARPRK